MSGQVIYTGTEEEVVRAVDTRTWEEVTELTGHRCAVLDMVMEGDTGVTVSEDGTARVLYLRVNRIWPLIVTSCLSFSCMYNACYHYTNLHSE